MKAVIAVIAFALAFPVQAESAEIKVVTQGAFRGILPTLAPVFERASEHKVTFSIFTPGVLKERLLKGEAADVAFLDDKLFPDVERAGKIIAGSRTELGGAYVAVAIRAGEPKPDLSTPDAVKRMIRAAKSVAISDPAGGSSQGPFVLGLADRFAFDAELRSRFKLIPGAGNHVAEAVVKGDAEIGITISTAIIFVKGAEIAGPLPPQMQNRSVYYAVLVTGTTQPKAGKALIDFMLSPEAKSVMKSSGVEPR
jgi:molybdate transport system substrate-binding protein